MYFFEINFLKIFMKKIFEKNFLKTNDNRNGRIVTD